MGWRARPTGHLRASPIAYAAEPASTGTARSPVPTMPSAKMVSASAPAIGRTASAAWAEVSTSVTPLTFSVAAVVIIIASAITLGQGLDELLGGSSISLQRGDEDRRQLQLCRAVHLSRHGQECDRPGKGRSDPRLGHGSLVEQGHRPPHCTAPTTRAVSAR